MSCYQDVWQDHETLMLNTGHCGHHRIAICACGTHVLPDQGPAIRNIHGLSQSRGASSLPQPAGLAVSEARLSLNQSRWSERTVCCFLSDAKEAALQKVKLWERRQVHCTSRGLQVTGTNVATSRCMQNRVEASCNIKKSGIHEPQCSCEALLRLHFLPLRRSRL